MKVFDPDNANHTFSFIPRFDVTGNMDLYIYNETTKETTTKSTVTYTLTDGVVDVSFTFTFTDKGKYQLKAVKNGGDVVYRGKAIATNQTPDEYKLTTDLYFYE